MFSVAVISGRSAVHADPSFGYQKEYVPTHRRSD